MNRLKTQAFSQALWLATLAVTLTANCLNVNTNAQTHLDKAEIVKRASKSYYSVRTDGLIEFHALVKPTWEVIVKDAASKPEGLRLLNGLKFTMSFDDHSVVKVNHEIGIPAPNADTTAAFNQIFSGMEQALTGFFDTWNVFMVNSPFPEADGIYQLTESNDGYLLTYKEGESDIDLSLKDDLTIALLKVENSEFVSSITPEFANSERGRILTGYHGTYLPKKGSGKVDLNIQVDYQDAEGIKLPQRLRLHSVLDGEVSEMELKFSDYQVRKR